MKKILMILGWFSAMLVTLLLSLQTYNQISKTQALRSLLAEEARTMAYAETPFLAYAALPDTASDIKSAIETGDARPVMIELYLQSYNSPMAGYGQLIFDTALRYGVDPYLVIAIAQQESNLGKKMPTEDCHNAWGYGIHSRGRLCFSSWEEGIEAVIRGLSNRFLAKGLDEPQEIMAVYTPLSNGSWANGVNQFLEELQTGNF